MVKSGEFPKPFKIGLNCTVWDASEVEVYIKQQRERGAA